MNNDRPKNTTKHKIAVTDSVSLSISAFKMIESDFLTKTMILVVWASSGGDSGKQTQMMTALANVASN